MCYIFSDESKVLWSYSRWRSLILVNRQRLKFEKMLIKVAIISGVQTILCKSDSLFMRFKLPAVFFHLTIRPT